MCGYFADRPRADVAACLPDRQCGTIALRRRGEVDRRLRQVELSFRQPDVLDRLGGSNSDEQRHRVGHADVLARQDHHPAGDEPGVLAGLQHPGQPVHSSIGIRSPHRLDECADHVVVVVAAVPQGARRERGLDVGDGDLTRLGQRPRHLERREHLATVAPRPIEQ